MEVGSNCASSDSAFTGISGNMKVYSELFFIIVRINEFWGRLVYQVASTNCFMSSKLLLQVLKFDIVYDNGVSLQKIGTYMKFPKGVPVVGANGPFYLNFAPATASQACIF